MQEHKTKLLLITLVCMQLMSFAHGQTSQQPQIPSQIPAPRYNMNKIPLNSYITQKQKLSTFRFPQINYEVSAKYYIRNSSLSQDLIYNIEEYDNAIDYSCMLYLTSMSTKSRNSIPYPQSIQVIKHFLFDLPSGQSHLYLLGSNSVIYKYLITELEIVLMKNYTLDASVSKINNNELQRNLEIEVFAGTVVLAAGEGMWVIYQGQTKDKNTTYSFQKIQTVFKYQPSQRLVDFGSVKRKNNSLNGNVVWVCSDKDIKIYGLVQQNDQFSVKRLATIQNLTNDTILSIYYDQEHEYFYLTTPKSLVVSKLPSLQQTGPPATAKTYSLPSTCSSVNKIKQALYLSCQYQKISYIAQYRVEQDNVILNRYYDERMVEGVRTVQTMGYDKIAVIGDQQALVIGQAVNRVALEELGNRNIWQLQQGFYSFGMINIFNLPSYSTPQKSVNLVISQQQLSIKTLIFDPPQLQCTFKPETSGTVQVLAVFNTTHCPYSTMNPRTIGGLYLLCTTMYPFKIDLATKQYQQKTAKFIFYVFMLLAIVLVLVFAGCGVKIRNRANAIINAAQQKIQKIRRQREQSELKKL